MRKFLVINGPNLNLLGEREKHIYGVMSVEQINEKIINHFKDQSIHIDFFQSNHEGEIIDKIQKARTAYSGVVINPGAYSHYSIAILDAIKSVDMPFIEVHLSNIYSREEFRRISVTAVGCHGVVSGLGYFGYIMALEALLNKLNL